MSKKFNLPRFEDQLLKFSHLRYKIIPIPDATSPDGDTQRFFEELGLPNYTTYIQKDDAFAQVALFPNGGITAAFKINPDNGEADIGICKCNISDVYTKSQGRVRAEGRFEKKHVSTKNTHFDTFICLDINDVVEPDVPLSSTVRNCIINEASEYPDVKTDMAMIRAWAAFRTSVPFYVELS